MLQTRTSPGPIAKPDGADQAETLLNHLFRYRRLDLRAGTCVERPCRQCLASLLLRVRRSIVVGEPVRFVLPGFPAKSPSPRKVLGPRPDMAEEQALLYLQRLCDELTTLYRPGVRINICSDGRVFSDLVGVSDTTVTQYGRDIRAMITRLRATSLQTFSLDDVFSGTSFDAMRRYLCARYAEPVELIRTRTRVHPTDRTLYNGIHRFLFEDRLGIENGKSRNQIRKACREYAYQVIRRSNAWSRLIAERLPEALRLSIHPQPLHAQKIGILLSDTAANLWITPWHGVAVQEGGRFLLMYRHQAEALGARLVERYGRPSHYVLDESRSDFVTEGGVATMSEPCMQWMRLGP
jgi:pyoverdine/dityrosine biosynthesis protein Dit1